MSQPTLVPPGATTATVRSVGADVETIRRRRRPNWFSWLAVGLGALALAVFAVTEIQHRLDARSKLGIGDVSLTADPITIASNHDGTVLSTDVGAQDNVEAGQILAMVLPPRGSTIGSAPQPLLATTDGTVLGIISAGSTVGAGDTIVTLYRPDEVYFQAPVRFEDLSEIRIGMTAHLTFPGLDPVTATVGRVASALPGPTGTTVDRALLILEPDDPAALGNVIPGLVLDGYIDLSSADSSAPTALSSVGNGG